MTTHYELKWSSKLSYGATDFSANLRTLIRLNLSCLQVLKKMHSKSCRHHCFSLFFFYSVVGIGHYSTLHRPTSVDLHSVQLGSWQLQQKWLQQPRRCVHPASPPSFPLSSPHPCSSSSPPAFSSFHVQPPPEQNPPTKTAPPAGTLVRKVGQPCPWGVNIIDIEQHVRLMSGVACLKAGGGDDTFKNLWQFSQLVFEYSK